VSDHLSVLLPVRNGGPWLEAALRSLESQTHRADQIVIVDDGSTDNSMDVVSAVAMPEVVVVGGPGRGLAAALTAGLAATRPGLVARLDQDDLAEPTRFEKQVELLNGRPRVVMCGTWARMLAAGRPTRIFRPPTEMPGIRRYLCLGNPFVHSSVMFRREAVLAAGGYWSPDADPYPEDFDLWSRMAAVGELAVLGEPLVTYRRQASGLLSVGGHRVGAAAARIAAENLAGATGVKPNSAERAVLRCFNRAPDAGDEFTLTDVRRLLQRIESIDPGQGRRTFPITTVLRLYGSALKAGR
jgi:glycosyltransferase involved in cell wall biosynthesis